MHFRTGRAVTRLCTALTGKGEKGNITINVTSDGDGDANALAAFTVEASSVGIPEEYTYSAT